MNFSFLYKIDRVLDNETTSAEFVYLGLKLGSPESSARVGYGGVWVCQ